VLRRFHLRPNSGGEGAFKGGDGCVRDLEFRKDLTVSILSERRVYSTPGMEGGGNGSVGRNLVRFSDGKVISLGGKNSISLRSRDAIVVESPGGGGYGGAEYTAKIKSPKKTHRGGGSLEKYTREQESA
jgi:5-oxoprolinase (ATP-hydrolysing)